MRIREGGSSGFLTRKKSQTCGMRCHCNWLWLEYWNFGYIEPLQMCNTILARNIGACRPAKSTLKFICTVLFAYVIIQICS